MLCSLDRLHVRLQRVAQFSQAARHRDMGDRIALPRQLPGQGARRLVRTDG